jgi:hypothetical protein
MLNAWSVSVIGRLATLTDPEAIDPAVRLVLAPWASSSGTLVGLLPELYSGRRRSERPVLASSIDG